MQCCSSRCAICSRITNLCENPFVCYSANSSMQLQYGEQTNMVTVCDFNGSRNSVVIVGIQLHSSHLAALLFPMTSRRIFMKLRMKNIMIFDWTPQLHISNPHHQYYQQRGPMTFCNESKTSPEYICKGKGKS